MNVKSFLKETYLKLPLINLTENNFYIFLKQNLEDYLTSLAKIEDKDFSQLISSEEVSSFKSTYTLRRLKNLIKKINKDILKVLSLCYKGDILNANTLLYKILMNQRYNHYLNQEYINFFKFDIKGIEVFYRMRDVKTLSDDKQENIVDNCWHVPYNNRSYAYSGRYSFPRFPSLYLGNTIETCNAELGELKRNYSRWVCKFAFKKPIVLFDLRIHTANEIDDSTAYDQLCYLITYPVIVACTTMRKSKTSDDEYFISQFLLHLLLISKINQSSHKGIIYSSTKIQGGENIVIPATYKGEEPPQNGYSEDLMELCETDKPQIYTKNN